MTKQEIKDLIAEKISGQGNQVDIGGALPTILGEILDAIPTEPTGLQFGGVLSDGDTVPETPNMFYAVGAGHYSGTFEGEEEAIVANGNIAFFIVDAQGVAAIQTIATGGGGVAPITLDYDPRIVGIIVSDLELIQANYAAGCTIVITPNGPMQVYLGGTFGGYLRIEEGDEGYQVFAEPFEDQ